MAGTATRATRSTSVARVPAASPTSGFAIPTAGAGRATSCRSAAEPVRRAWATTAPPPPGWGQPAAPVKKSRRSLWITLGVIFGVLVLAIGSCTVFFVTAIKAPVDASNRFLSAIDDGDYARAISLSDPGCSLGMSEADLANAFQGADITYNLNNSSVTNSSATVSGSFSVVGQNVSSIALQLRNIDGWKICGFNAN